MEWQMPVQNFCIWEQFFGYCFEEGPIKRIGVTVGERGIHLYIYIYIYINPLNAELNPICHLLALLAAHHIFHVSGLRVKD